MKKRVIALLCLCILLLSGCQVLELLRQVTEEGRSTSSKKDEETPRSSAAEDRASAPPAASDPASSQPNSASGDALESIVRAAGPNDLMAVLQNPASEAYRSLGAAKAEIDDFESGNGSGMRRF